MYEEGRAGTAVIEPLLSVTGVCRALGVSRGTVYNFVRAGELA